jgi:uncharacterized protein
VQPLQPGESFKLACDAMCGGVARWLRVLGIDASYTPGIDDGDLVQHALAERRVVLSSDGKLFERRPFTTGDLRGLRLPVGLKLQDQLRFVVQKLSIVPGFPRCTLYNGTLEAVSRAEISDSVPARSLIWATEFYRCLACQHIFWEGTHWQRIRAVRDRVIAGQAPNGKSLTTPDPAGDNHA